MHNKSISNQIKKNDFSKTGISGKVYNYKLYGSTTYIILYLSGKTNIQQSHEKGFKQIIIYDFF